MDENTYDNFDLDNYDGDIGDSEYSTKTDFSKAGLAYEQFKDCMNKRSKEMKQGYFNSSITRDGIIQKSWVQDTRKAYWSSVQALRRLLAPEIIDVKDKTLKSKIESILDKMDKSYDKYCYYEYDVKIKDGKTIYEKTENKSMPEIDELVNVKSYNQNGDVVIKRLIGGWNKNVNSYWDEMVYLSDMLLEEMIKIIHMGNYFKKGGNGF